MCESSFADSEGTQATTHDGLFPVRATPEQHAELARLADEVDSDELARRAIAMGITPSLDEIAYWEIAVIHPDYVSDTTELVWLGPDPNYRGHAR